LSRKSEGATEVLTFDGSSFGGQTFDCQSCGACCAYSAAWPRFTLESDAELDYLPPELVRPDLSGMACAGDRCLALAGTIGDFTCCTIHPIRPDVCRACEPGDPECLMARAFHGMPALERGGASSTSG
jgi:hypothetical protein